MSREIISINVEGNTFTGGSGLSISNFGRKREGFKKEAECITRTCVKGLEVSGDLSIVVDRGSVHVTTKEHSHESHKSPKPLSVGQYKKIVSELATALENGAPRRAIVQQLRTLADTRIIFSKL